jgi:gas vesicle protein
MRGSMLPFVFGVGVGAVTALLFSPKMGEDMRKAIADGVSEGGRQIAAGGKKSKQRMEKVSGQAQSRAQEAFDSGKDMYDQATNS